MTDPDRLVGRDRELGLLFAAVGELARGRGSAVWVEGEPGVGKSALVHSGIAAAGDLGCDVLWGTADQLSQHSPLQELVEALLREQMIRVADGVADLSDEDAGRVPVSLADALSIRLSFVPDLAVATLDTAAMLGQEFTVTELATLVREPVPVLSNGLGDAVTAGILLRSGSRMAFRHPLIRQALYERLPAPVRAALHLDAARVLADAENDPLTVAQQLLAADHLGDGWVRGWLLAAAYPVAARAPELAATLLRRELGRPSSTAAEQAPVLAALARILLAMGRHEEAASHARRATSVVTGPEDRGEMLWVLTRALIGGGHTDEAIDALRDVFGRPEQLGSWHPAVEHYRAAGPAVDLAGALEDLAVVLAGRDTAVCRAALNEAVELYAGFGATWDIRRTDARLRRQGIRRGVRGARTPRTVTGWAALTDTERRVAMLIAEGRSTVDIAAVMFLSRRTVQTHVSHVLAKLDLHSRVEFARDVYASAGTNG